jgi:hypothetical protein
MMHIAETMVAQPRWRRIVCNSSEYGKNRKQKEKRRSGKRKSNGKMRHVRGTKLGHVLTDHVGMHLLYVLA